METGRRPNGGEGRALIDLNNIRRYHENNRIEAKKAAGGFPHSLWETYSAFANTVGGLILLGVEESRDKKLTVTGVPDPEGYQRILWETVNDPARVSANILSPEDVAVHEIDGKPVLVVHVPRADRRHRPVYIGDSPFQGAYRRDGEGDYHCSPEEVRAMLRDRTDTPADLAVLVGRPASDLSPEAVRQFRLRMVMRQPSHPWNTMPDRRFLVKAGALGTARAREEPHPTLAGLLLLGRRSAVREVFPRLRLIYREEETGFSLSSVTAEGPEDLYQYYAMVTARLAAVAALLEADAARRAQLAAAFREAVGNAVLHADYFSKGGLVIQRTATELRVSNGGLLRVSPEEAGEAPPDLRNRALARMFSLLKPDTGEGNGLRSIYRVWDQRGWRKPVLSEAFRDGVTELSLPLPGDAIPRESVDRQQLLEYLTDQVSARGETAAAALGLPLRETEACLRSLLREGLVVETEQGYALRA